MNTVNTSTTKVIDIEGVKDKETPKNAAGQSVGQPAMTVITQS